MPAQRIRGEWLRLLLGLLGALGRLALCVGQLVLRPDDPYSIRAHRERAMRRVARRGACSCGPDGRHLAGRGAERLIVALTNHRVLITSNYTGVELVLFGAVERDAGAADAQRALRYRRHRYRAAGIAAHAAQAARARHLGEYRSAHLCRSALLSRGSGEPAARRHHQPRRTQRRLQLGIANTPLPELIHNDIGEVSSDPFRAALIGLMRERGLYSEEPNAVTFLTPTLFRAAIALPAQVPIGNYAVDVKLFADGNLVARYRFGLRDRQGRL